MNFFLFANSFHHICCKKVDLWKDLFSVSKRNVVNVMVVDYGKLGLGWY